MVLTKNDPDFELLITFVKTISEIFVFLFSISYIFLQVTHFFSLLLKNSLL